MKFTVRKQDLQRELALTQGVVESKATIQVLSHLLLRAGKDGLELLATDLEIGLRTRCAADVTRAGGATVPAKKLHEVVRALECETVSLEATDGGWVRIEGGSFKGRVVALPEADFPTQPEWPSGTSSVRVPTVALQQMIARTLFAVTSENTRFSINGALLRIAPKSLTLVATDGHRLAHVVRPCDLPEVTSEISVLVPRKALLELGRLRTQDENEEVEIASSGNHVFFRTPGRMLFSRTLEGTFPSYDRVIPADNKVIVKVSRKALQDVIGRVALLTSESAKLVTFQFAGDALTIATSNPATGEASEDIAIEHDGADVKIGLNHEYVQQFLSVAETDRIEIHLKDSNTQALLQPEDASGVTYQYVVMPMRLT